MADDRKGANIDSDVVGGQAARRLPPTAPDGKWPQPVSARWTRRRVAVAGVVVAALFGAMWLFRDDSETSTRSSGSGSYVAVLDDAEVVNPASIRVFVSVTNTGGGTGSPSCTVRASDPSGTYRGYDIFEVAEVIGPGEVARFNGTVVITDQGASYVDDVSVECV